MDHPYRPPPPVPDPELAKLARVGQQRRMEAAAAHDVERDSLGDYYLRTAIGAYRGSTRKRGVLAAVVSFLVVGAIGGSMAGELAPIFIACFPLAFIGFMVWIFMTPLASTSTLAQERAWSTSFPFPLEGYFDTLAAAPRFELTLTIAIAWQPQGRAPEKTFLENIINSVDPKARVERVDHHGATIVTGPISGFTGIKINGVRIHRNHRIPPAVHALVEQVLVPLHRSHAIANVAFHR